MRALRLGIVLECTVRRLRRRCCIRRSDCCCCRYPRTRLRTPRAHRDRHIVHDCRTARCRTDDRTDRSSGHQLQVARRPDHRRLRRVRCRLPRTHRVNKLGYRDTRYRRRRSWRDRLRRKHTRPHNGPVPRHNYKRRLRSCPTQYNRSCRPRNVGRPAIVRHIHHHIDRIPAGSRNVPLGTLPGRCTRFRSLRNVRYCLAPECTARRRVALQAGIRVTVEDYRFPVRLGWTS